MGDEIASKKLRRWGLAGTFVAFSSVLICFQYSLVFGLGLG